MDSWLHQPVLVALLLFAAVFPVQAAVCTFPDGRTEAQAVVRLLDESVPEAQRRAMLYSLRDCKAVVLQDASRMLLRTAPESLQLLVLEVLGELTSGWAEALLLEVVHTAENDVLAQAALGQIVRPEALAAIAADLNLAGRLREQAWFALDQTTQAEVAAAMGIAVELMQFGRPNGWPLLAAATAELGGIGLAFVGNAAGQNTVNSVGLGAATGVLAGALAGGLGGYQADIGVDRAYATMSRGLLGSMLGLGWGHAIYRDQQADWGPANQGRKAANRRLGTAFALNAAGYAAGLLDPNPGSVGQQAFGDYLVAATALGSYSAFPWLSRKKNLSYSLMGVWTGTSLAAVAINRFWGNRFALGPEDAATLVALPFQVATPVSMLAIAAADWDNNGPSVLGLTFTGSMLLASALSALDLDWREKQRHAGTLQLFAATFGTGLGLLQPERVPAAHAARAPLYTGAALGVAGAIGGYFLPEDARTSQSGVLMASIGVPFGLWQGFAYGIPLDVKGGRMGGALLVSMAAHSALGYGLGYLDGYELREVPAVGLFGGMAGLLGAEIAWAANASGDNVLLAAGIASSIGYVGSLPLFGLRDVHPVYAYLVPSFGLAGTGLAALATVMFTDRASTISGVSIGGMVVGTALGGLTGWLIADHVQQAAPAMKHTTESRSANRDWQFAGLQVFNLPGAQTGTGVTGLELVLRERP